MNNYSTSTQSISVNQALESRRSSNPYKGMTANIDQATMVTRAKTAVDIVNDALRACSYSFDFNSHYVTGPFGLNRTNINL